MKTTSGTFCESTVPEYGIHRVQGLSYTEGEVQLSFCCVILCGRADLMKTCFSPNMRGLRTHQFYWRGQKMCRNEPNHLSAAQSRSVQCPCCGREILMSASMLDKTSP